jgi:hypothetical protein
MDTSGKGYIEKTDLESAFGKAAATGQPTADEMFSKIDANGDGKVTKSEFSDSIKKFTEQMDSHLMSMRQSGKMPQGGQMPMGAPPAGQSGMSGSSGANGATTSSSSNSNTDPADTNGDGTVSAKESIAYSLKQSMIAGGQSESEAATNSAKLIRQLDKLVEAYGISQTDSTQLSSLSLKA